MHKVLCLAGAAGPTDWKLFFSHVNPSGATTTSADCSIIAKADRPGRLPLDTHQFVALRCRRRPSQCPNTGTTKERGGKETPSSSSPFLILSYINLHRRRGLLNCAFLF